MARIHTTRPMKICHVCSGHSVGDGRVFRRACVSLAAAGYDVHLIARGEAKSIYSEYGVMIHPLPQCTSRRKRLARRHLVARMAAEIEPDLYHVHEPELLGPVIARAGSKPVVYDVHESYLDVVLDRDWIPRLLRPLVRVVWDRTERRLLRRCALVVAATDIVAERYLALHPNVITIANYPDLRDISSASATAKQPNACVFTGTLLPNRGLHQAISAIGLLKRRGLIVPFIIAGSGPSEFIGELLRHAEREHLGDLMTYKGELARTDALAVASACGIGLVPHLPYGNNLAAWPVKMMEYMALGLPLVYSDLPSHRQVADRWNVGLAVDPENTEEIAGAIEHLVTHPDLAKRMGRAGKRAAEEVYNWDAESRKLLRAYAQLLNPGER